MLPKNFEERMKQMLGKEYEAFLLEYEREEYHSLRINTLKTDFASLDEKSHFKLEPVAWTRTGYYYDNLVCQPGKHPLHEAGAYYIQEASAMAPAEYLGAKPGEYILDLCAAPGGKTTQIACDMQGEGILVSNEIHPARAKILSENVERMGIKNALVLNETPQKLEKVFQAYFDRILVDAPCSGEGMFRKNDQAMDEWSLENVELCARRQDEILACAANMLKPGGKLVYSTCTFAPQENEGTISRFLENHPEFSLCEVKRAEGMAEGNPAWGNEMTELARTIRLWPHKLKGEGHYLAVLKKDTDGIHEQPEEKKRSAELKKIPELSEFWNDMGIGEKFLEGREILRFGEQLYLVPHNFPKLDGLKVVRPGLHLGTLKKNRFEPSHALALALKKEEVKRYVDFETKAEEIKGFLRGETFAIEGEKGWYLICVDGLSIGFGKLAGGIMKNHYPKGLRKNGIH